MTVSVTPVSADIGVEVSGLSGHELVDRRRADECQALIDRHGVVIYREVDLDNDELVAFTRMLGDIVMGGMGRMESHPEIDTVSLDPEKSVLAAYRSGTFHWYVDGTNHEVPQKATLLIAREVSDEGGDTEFANLFAAYAALPEAEKAELEGRRVLHSFAATQRLVHPEASDGERRGWDKVPSQEHPIVWTRSNGRKSLLIGTTADHVVGWPEDESRALLDRLLAWATQPRFVLRHHWSIGDLVVWDNTGMLHRAIPYEATSRRLLHRTTLVGEEAVA
ncbi:MAG: Taurine catabolism dioxygenase TauD/TfdA [Ilumatobacteraceae bacterium]|nr:Taurine catabolism dioxygenase TauD/TfdA [Ilumatobacteraceae bacterium]